MGTILLNTAVSTSSKLECKAGDIVQRDRFDTTTIQTKGKVYVSNWYRPSTDFSSDDWTEIDPIKPGFFVLDYPVHWVGCDADAAVCSYCGDNG